MAVQYFWNMNHTNIIVCAPEWMKMKQCRSVEAMGLLNESGLNYFPSIETHYLFGLQDHLQDLLIFIPSGASELCFMEALAKRIDGLIVTQLDEDTFTGISNKRIIQFIFTDTFILPKNPKGKDRGDLQTILQSNSVDEVDAVAKTIEQLKKTRKDYSSIQNETINYGIYTSEDHNLPRVIIDGGNVAKTHGLNIVYSWRGIFLAVQHFLGKGHHDIKVYVSICRKYSKYTMDEYKLQKHLKHYCHIVYVDSTTDDDCLMLDDAKTNNGWIVTNDEFRNYKQQRKDMKNR
ncbi:putative ribonuclease ZC3H12C [Alosa pseudoharengus]|uniref:putative ribonuclease ZC3H12C n=1 Tax=Alosa pseudoharengus TaxID=34774 RepID=UPI003F88FD52